MNVDAIRHFFDYHFAENRVTWDKYIVPLSHEQFTQPVDYSMGSVRNQIIHLMRVDDNWFRDLRGVEIPDWPASEEFNDRDAIRAKWDTIEEDMRGYLANLTDDMLDTKPLHGEDKDLRLWQVMFHLVNHGTDHRAQMLRILHDLGVKTVSQDYIFYVYDHLV